MGLTIITHEQMFMSGLSGGLPHRYFYSAPHMNNNSMVDDPRVNQAKADCSEYWMDEDKVAQIVKETAPYQLENAWFLQLPIAYSYTFWWPWVKNYGGDSQVGYCNYDDMARFVWIDQELKNKMTGQ